MKKSKIMTMLVLAFVCLVSVFSFTGCNNNLEIINIGLSKDIVTDYAINDKIDLNEAKLIITFEDNSQKSIAISSDMITGFDTTTAGTKTLKIKYKEEALTVKYNVYEKDFATVINKVSQTLYNENKYMVTESRFNSSTLVWNIYEYYIKNGNYFKSIPADSPSSYEIYDITNMKCYSASDGSTTTVEYTIKQIYSYAYVFVDTDYTIVKTSLSFDNNLYRLEYNFIDNNSAYQVTAIVSADNKVQEILVTQGLNKVAKLDYVYTDVAEIVWPN